MKIKTSLAVLSLLSISELSAGEQTLKGFYISTALWNKNQISVCWNTTGFTTEKSWVKDTVEKSWEANSVIDFIGWKDCDKNGADIRIQIADENPVTTGLGTQTLDNNPGLILNFTFNNFRKDQCQGSEETCIRNSAVHEFGHALGIAHEQNRDDTSSTCAKSGTYGDTTVGSYDVMSIMHYCHPERNGKYGQKFFDLSQGDIETINQMYNSHIGVIPATSSCPSNSELVTIHMDDEDSRNKNSQNGWIGAIESSSNTTFKFCKVKGAQFKPLYPKEPYAVLKLGKVCPNGSKTLIRKFDNENTQNKNYMSANASPNVNDGNTYMHFCLFDSTNQSSSMTSFPTLGIQYGVFAGSGFSKSLASGYIHTDDEDKKNRNYFSGDNTESQKIISGTTNTDINIRRVKSLSVPVQPVVEDISEVEEIIADDIIDGNNSIKYISIVKVQ